MGKWNDTFELKEMTAFELLGQLHVFYLFHQGLYSCLQKGWRFPIWVTWKQTKQNKPYCRVYLKFTLSHSRSQPSVFQNHNVLPLLSYLIYYLYSRRRSVCHFLSKCISNQHKNGGDSRAGRALDFASFYILFTHCRFIGGFTYNRRVYKGGMMGTEAKPYNWVILFSLFSSCPDRELPTFLQTAVSKRERYFLYFGSVGLLDLLF